MVKPAKVFRHSCEGTLRRNLFTPQEANLQFLSCEEYLVPPGKDTGKIAYPGHEALLFMWSGNAVVGVGKEFYALQAYDVLYIPQSMAYVISNSKSDSARIFVTRAPAKKTHPIVHARFSDVSADEKRIRRLKGKNVFMMFDVSESADKLVAGYTFFEPYARSWPPHNHTDQEEVYIFLKGRGAMEVYESPEKLTFVHEVGVGDAVTIPFLNYHPVFSQDMPLEFIWCIAGERYWVGDRSKEFMKGTSESITT